MREETLEFVFLRDFLHSAATSPISLDFFSLSLATVTDIVAAIMLAVFESHVVLILLEHILISLC